MADEPELVFRARPPAEAVDYLQRKAVGGRFSFDWRDVWQEEHLNAFVVAKAAEQAVLADIHAALLKAIQEGQTREQFIKDLTPVLQARGWWGTKTQIDPETGEEKLVQLGSPRRLKTIFETNMRMAHQAGRYERFARSFATRPFLRYEAVLDARTRPQHAAWHGVTLRYDHPFWKTHLPPNGWNCRCTFTSERQATPTSEDELKAKGAYDLVPWANKRTGAVDQVPKGVDHGFGYNVGAARLQGLVPPAIPEPNRASAIGPRIPAALPEEPAPRAAPEIRKRPELEGAGVDQVFEAFASETGHGEGQVMIDRAQIPVVVGRAMFEARGSDGQLLGSKADARGRAAYVEYLARTLQDPDEIWHSWQTRGEDSVLVRNYVARFDVPGEGPRWFLVVYRQREGVWMGTTAFPIAEGRGPDRQRQVAATTGRVGVLVYQRKRPD